MIDKEMIKDILENELEKVERYRWHDLRKNPDDLPENDSEVIYCKAVNNGFIYGRCDFYEGFNCSKDDKENEMKGLSGWRYIEPMED